MASADAWEQLATTALLGTERAGDLPLVDNALADILRSTDNAPREQQLLATAAAMDLYGRAGILAPKSTGPVAEAPLETLPRVSPRAEHHLQTLLGAVAGYPEEILREWLETCATRQRRVPEGSLAALLGTAARSKSLRPIAKKVMGSRGEWLAALNPEWRELFAAAGPDVWEVGNRDARTACLRELRHADGSTARTLLEKTWPTETPEDRTAFIAVFEDNLTMADEPFLESALDDKRKEVRQSAANLLARLPESRFAQRMLARLTPLVTLHRSILGKRKLEVTVPEEHTKEMLRDAIPAASGFPGMGEKASHLVHIIAATPLSFWSGILRLAPDEIPDLLKKSDFLGSVMAGLTIAAVSQKDAAFMRSIVHYWIASPRDGSFADDLTRLILAMSPADREAALLPALQGADSLISSDNGLTSLLACTHPWSLPFSNAFARQLMRYIHDGEKSYSANRAIDARFGLYVHPGIAAALVAQAQADDSIRSTHLDTFLAMLQFRHDMLKELAQ